MSDDKPAAKEAARREIIAKAKANPHALIRNELRKPPAKRGRRS